MRELTERLAMVSAEEVFSVQISPGEFCVFYRGFSKECQLPKGGPQPLNEERKNAPDPAEAEPGA